MGRRSDILAQITDIASSPSRRILLVAEPGMGKSTILRQAAASLEATGFRVLRVNPASAERQIAYNALWDQLSTVDWENTPLREEYRVFMRVALGTAAPTEPLPPLSISVAVEALLTHLAAEAPVVMLIDDAQWVDPESELVIHRAWRRCRHLPVYAVTTRRSASTENSPAGELAATDSLVLSGLSLSELDTLARETLGTSLAAPQLTALHAHSGGNPMWARELMLGGFVTELGTLPVGTIAAPATLSESVDARLNELGEVSADIVSVVALIGRSTVEQITTVLGLDSAPHDAIAEAENASLLVVSTQEFRVAHPLHASAAVARLTPSRRRQLHAAIARSEGGVELMARHLHQSEPPGPLEDIAAILDRAAEAAGRRGAPIQAAHFAAQAVARSDAESTDRDYRLLFQAQQLSAVGDYLEAANVLNLVDPLLLDTGGFDRYVALASTAIALSHGVAASHEHLEALASRPHVDARRAAIITAFAEEDYISINEQMRLARGVLDVLDPEVTPFSARRAIGVLLRAEIDLGLGLNPTLMRGAREDLDHAYGALNETAYAQQAFFSRDLDDIDSSRTGLAELVRRSQARGEDGVASMFSVHAAATEILAGDYQRIRLRPYQRSESGCPHRRPTGAGGLDHVPPQRRQRQRQRRHPAL